MRRDLRDYQAGAKQAAAGELLEGRSTLLHLATGTGKTWIFAALAADVCSVGGRVLVIAHRTELLGQAAEALRAWGIERVEIEQGSRRASLEAQAVVASIQTLRGKRRERWPREHFDLIVIDEAHHSRAKTYESLVEYFEGAMLLGVTATPYRGDGKGLGKIFESVAYSYGLRAAIDDGWLVPLSPRRVVVEEVDLDGIAVRAGDFVAKQLDEAYGEEAGLHGVARPLLELAGDRPTIVFASGVDHARQLAAVINGYRPEAAVALSGKTDPVTRERELELFRAHRRQFLIQCQLFTEGTDLPMCSCVAIARPTKSRGLYEQILGRGTRLYDATKTDCLVIDFVGTTTKHKLASAVRVMAGDRYDDEVIAEAEDLAGADMGIDEALEAADELLAKRRERERRQAKVRWFAEEVDPFTGKKIPPGQSEGVPATERQLEGLAKWGFEVDADVELSKAEASAILDAMAFRQRHGYVVGGLARRLARRGIDVRELSAADARQIRDTWEAHGWRLSNEELSAIAEAVVAGDEDQQQRGTYVA